MKKKILSLVLTICMVLTMIPVTAFAAPQGYDNLGTVSDGSGQFVDETAKSGEKYEYIIEGSDGTKATVTAGGEVTPEASTGNSVVTVEGTPVKYVKVDNLSKLDQNKKYIIGAIIPNKNVNTITSDLKLKKVSYIETSKELSGTINAKDEWNVNYNQENGTVSLENNGQYLAFAGGGYFKAPKLEMMTSPNIKYKENSKESLKIYITKGDYLKKDWYIDVDGTEILVTEENSKASNICFFEKQPAVLGGYTVDTAGLDDLISKAEAEKSNQPTYTATSWQALEDALVAAKNAKDTLETSYSTKEEAEAALAEIDKTHTALDTAIKGLTKDETYVPEETIVDVHWERTLEPRKEAQYVQNQTGKLVLDVNHLDADNNIKWNWDQVKDLTTDPSMNVWDFATKDQYSVKEGQIHSQTDIKAATWNDWSTNTSKDSWKYSSVRRFHGTFKWPAGYTLDDKLLVTSKNDAKYKPIYDYINMVGAPENEKTPDRIKLQSRYGESSIVAVNDSMYVFISKKEEPSTWDEAHAAKHLAFWSGSDGKGIWSHDGNDKGDWARRKPATFAGFAATPAFHQYMPNNRDTNPDSNFEQISGWEDYMEHSNGWYSFIDSTAMMSSLRKNYKGQHLDGKDMSINIFCFDNSGIGGMDELELKFVKSPESEKPIVVKYYLNAVSGEPLDTSMMYGKVGDEITLNEGYGVSELNFAQEKANILAGENFGVTDGVQQEKPYIVKEGNNVINVIYRTKLADAKYFTYDFGVSNSYTANIGSEIQNPKIEGVPEIRNVNPSSDGKGVDFTFTPKDAHGQLITAKLNYKLKDGTPKSVPICIVPASNVLYEENMFTVAQGDNTWKKVDGSTADTVIDNESTVFGYTKSYDTSLGQFGGYKSNITEPNGKTKRMKIDFTGRGFDLIGSCGPNTGTLSVKLLKNGEYQCGYIVDTGFEDGKIGEIYQVPVIHETGLEPASYQLVITGFGYGLNDEVSVSTYSLNDNKGSKNIYDVMADMGFSEEEMGSVEIIGANDIMGASTYALESEGTKDKTKTTEAQGIKQVTVDALRVYKTSSVEAGQINPFPENEQDIIYTNVMQDGITGNLVAYVEPSKTGETTQNSFDITEYEAKGGPENEIYLAPNQGIAFTFEGIESAPQISARLVNDTGSVVLNDGTKKHTINHNTEMYYEVSANGNKITIKNEGDGILALGNIKSKSAVKALTTEQQAEVVKMFALMANDDTDKPDVKPDVKPDEKPDVKPDEKPDVKPDEKPDVKPDEKPEPDKPSEPEEEIEKVFTPERFDVDVDVHKFFGKKNVKLKIKTSKDVEYIIVDGKKYTASRSFWGRRSDTKTFKISKKFSKNDTVKFEVKAYNKDELGSYTYVVEENCVTIKEVNAKALKEATPLKMQ